MQRAICRSRFVSRNTSVRQAQRSRSFLLANASPGPPDHIGSPAAILALATATFLFVRSGPGGYRALQSHATGSGTATADRQVWAAKVLVNAPANPDLELYATHTALWSELNNNPLFLPENLQQIQDAAVAARPSTPAGRRPGMVVRSITWWQHGVGLDMQGAVTAGAPRELCLLIERSLPLGVVPNIQHQQFSVFFFQKISLRAAADLTRLVERSTLNRQERTWLQANRLASTRIAISSNLQAAFQDGRMDVDEDNE